jgi:hypothetical protein
LEVPAVTITMRLNPVAAEDLDTLRQQDDVSQEFYDYPACDLDQMWDVLDALLGADPASVASAAVTGGARFGEDQGYGPPRTLRPDEVAAIAAALSSLTIAEMRNRFTTVDLTDRYHGENCGFDEVYRAFQNLQTCYSESAAAGHAMALYM